MLQSKYQAVREIEYAGYLELLQKHILDKMLSTYKKEICGVIIRYEIDSNRNESYRLIANIEGKERTFLYLYEDFNLYSGSRVLEEELHPIIMNVLSISKRKGKISDILE